ncbi:hypothetical protein HIM_01475 [Hirsutella minnesotensis 3608]|nr:hypothetical protein HIM_01475 [Hirsutella minnesotensis 3608]
MRPRAQKDGEEPLESPMTFVIGENHGDVHIFLPKSLDLKLVELIAQNFSRRVQQPVKVFLDDRRNNYRLCPFEIGVEANISTYGSFCFECDSSIPNEAQITSQTNLPPRSMTHIPRPRNSWILFRQQVAKRLRLQHPGITASELSTMISRMWKQLPKAEKAVWQQKAKEEDRLHKEKYPGYKYTTKRTPKKSK